MDLVLIDAFTNLPEPSNKKNTFLVCYILFIVCMHLDLRLTYTK
jgi:hypothetical protein